jgi:hypothetical protein
MRPPCEPTLKNLVSTWRAQNMTTRAARLSFFNEIAVRGPLVADILDF